jgi:predicted nucleic acid-binding protein
MTREPKEQFERCLEIMGKIEGGKERVATSVFTVAEIGHILGHREGLNTGRVKKAIISLLDSLGLKLLDAEAIVCREAVELKTEYDIDFVDAYNVLTMRRNKIKEIYSLDEHYDMFKDIKRII